MSHSSVDNEYFLLEDEKPGWLAYPPIFKRVLEARLTDFHPWHILKRHEVLTLRESLASSYYPEERLVSAGSQTDCDDIACFDKANPDGITIFNMEFRGESGRRQAFSSFYDWFRIAISDFLDFEPAEDKSWYASPRKDPAE